MEECEIEVTKLTPELNYLERKNIQLRGEIQCLKDRIAGLTKENETLKQQLIIQKVILTFVERIKNAVKNVSNMLTRNSVKQ